MHRVSESHLAFAFARESASLVPVFAPAPDARNRRTSLMVVVPVTVKSSYGFVLGSAAWVDPLRARIEMRIASIDIRMTFNGVLQRFVAASSLQSCADDVGKANVSAN